MILYFCSFSFLETSIIKPLEEDTNHFSDKSLKNEIIKVKLVKPTQEKFYLEVITDACVKIAVLEIFSEKKIRESAVGT